MNRTEFVPNDRVSWQASDRMKIYQCPICLQSIFSQYEGEDVPWITCHGLVAGHSLRWPELEVKASALA